jgi:hypothetical protein
MRRQNVLLICLVLLGAQLFARQITGKTNAGSFEPQPAKLKLSAELSGASAENVLYAGEKCAIRIEVTNDGGSSAEGVVVKITLVPKLQGVTIPPEVVFGNVASGVSKTATVDIVAAKSSKSQRTVISIQAVTSSGIVSEVRPINLFLREPAKPIVIAVRDLTPPVIEILEPVRLMTRAAKLAPGTAHFVSNGSSITIKGIARDSGGVALIYVNGDEVKFNVTPQGAEFSATALLAMGQNDLEIRAVDRFRNESKFIMVVQREEKMIQGGYHALVIAVQDYEDANVNSLQYPIQDAQNLVSTLSTYYNFDEKNISFLKNPNRSSIIKTFDEFAKKLTEEDNLLIFYAGHGYWDERLKQGYWLPVDASRNSRTEWISNGTIRDYVAGMATKHTLLVSDACFSGGIFKTRDAFSKVTAATRELYRLPSRKAMTSGAMKEVPDRSVFVEYLIKRLRENKETLLPAETLFASFRQAVINNSPNSQIPQYGEIRETGDEGGDFIFVHK